MKIKKQLGDDTIKELVTEAAYIADQLPPVMTIRDPWDRPSSISSETAQLWPREPDLESGSPWDDKVLEWWVYEGKITLYIKEGVWTDLILVWGPDIHTQMKVTSSPTPKDFNEAWNWLNNEGKVQLARDRQERARKGFLPRLSA